MTSTDRRLLWTTAWHALCFCFTWHLLCVDIASHGTSPIWLQDANEDQSDARLEGEQTCHSLA